jgi:hypothetical protein
MSSFSETVKHSRADIEKASELTERRDEAEEKRLQLLREASDISRVAETLVPDEE